jgi:GNAT superfamily N-acetyltransferase
VGIIKAPALLNNTHDLSHFDCNNEILNEWLQKRALKNQDTGASRTFVICDDNKVIGYYALASGSVERLMAPKAIARNMPQPIPVIVLGRLAVDRQFQGQRLGAALLKDAMLRTLTIAQNVGIRALMVHAISQQAKDFYLSYEFKTSLVDPMALLISVANLRKRFNSNLS